MSRWTTAMATVPALTLSACALFQPPPLAVGQTEAQVVALLGAPTNRYAMPEQVTRLEFARGPFGRETWMVDLGADGRSQRFEQVLNTWHFVQVAERAPGLNHDQVLRLLGRPGHRQGLGWVGGEVWSWRYPTHDCLWFQIDFTAAGLARGAGYGIDPQCDVNDASVRSGT